MSFSPNAARKLPELYKPSLEHSKLERTEKKTGWVLLVVLTIRVKVAGLAARTTVGSASV